MNMEMTSAPSVLAVIVGTGKGSGQKGGLGMDKVWWHEDGERKGGRPCLAVLYIPTRRAACIDWEGAPKGG